MTNVSELNVKNDSLKIAYSDEVFTIVKTVGQADTVISLTPNEAAELLGKLMEYAQPWTPAS